MIQAEWANYLNEQNCPWMDNAEPGAPVPTFVLVGLRNPLMIAPSNHDSLLGFFWATRKEFAEGLMFALLRSLTIAPIPIAFKLIIDRFVPQRDISSIFITMVCVAVLLALHYIFAVRGAKRIGGVIARTIMDLRGEIFWRIQLLSFGYLDQQRTGKLLSKYAFDTQKVEGVGMQILNQLLPSMLYSLSVMAILMYLNWQLAFLLIFIVPLLGFLKTHFFQKIKHTHNNARLAQEKLTGTASEILTALRLVRSFGEEEKAKDRLAESSATVAEAYVASAEVGSRFGTFVFVSNQMLSLIVIAGGALLTIRSGLTMGTLLAFVSGLPALMMPVQMFAQLSDQYFLGQESFRSIREILDSNFVENWKGQRQIPNLRGEIEFREVAFAYASTRKGAINGLSLHIKAGERIALVGPSGSGKSTLASLLLGLYEPNHGEILIDGCPQADLDMRWFRQQIAIVMQDSILLSGTISENIRFARTTATDEEVLEAARLANAEEFILQMPDGFETRVGERGAMLSGGQRQRVSIARAILRNPPILILDEPTSSLDYQSERLIQEALDRLAMHRTVITIAHRLSTVRNADRIIVMRHGTIVEQGTFDELTSRPGHFQELIAFENQTAMRIGK